MTRTVQTAVKTSPIGVGTLPNPLQRQHYRQVGHLPLYLRTLASSRLPRAYQENLKRDLPHIPSPKTSGILPTPDHD